MTWRNSQKRAPSSATTLSHSESLSTASFVRPNSRMNGDFTWEELLSRQHRKAMVWDLGLKAQDIGTQCGQQVCFWRCHQGPTGPVDCTISYTNESHQMVRVTPRARLKKSGGIHYRNHYRNLLKATQALAYLLREIQPQSIAMYREVRKNASGLPLPRPMVS